MEDGAERTKEILETSHTIAMVGLSPTEDRPSNGVARYLKKAGYRVIPVNPGYDEILGEKSYKSLSEIPDRVDVVDIFMRADKVVPVVEEAVRIKPRYIWLQLGIVNEEARAIAEKAGIGFVMDKCMKQEHAKHFKIE
jgi:predicted CoA-binding protein